MLRNEFAEMGRLASFVEDYAHRTELPAKASFAIQVCLEEAVANIVRHGVAGGKATRIVASLHRQEENVSLCVEDNGGPFDPTLVTPPMPPASLEDAAIGGLGIHLMREFSSGMRYDRVAGENRLSMVFFLARYAPADAHARSSNPAE